MTSISYPNGCGQALGDYLATTKPLQASGNIWFVNSATGTDGASPAGKSDANPLATLTQALTNSADDDIIILMDGHTETSTADADWTTTKRVAIVGAGSSAGYPTVKLTCGNAGTGAFLYFNGTFGQLRNVWITTRAVANTGPRVKIGTAANNCSLIGCYFECGATDTGPALSVGSVATMRIVNTTFKSIATLRSAQPESAIKLTGTNVNMQLTGLVLDGGTVGFSNFYAFDSGSNAITHLEAEGISLLRGADMKLASATTGWVNIAESSGGSRVDW